MRSNLVSATICILNCDWWETSNQIISINHSFGLQNLGSYTLCRQESNVNNQNITIQTEVVHSLSYVKYVSSCFLHSHIWRYSHDISVFREKQFLYVLLHFLIIYWVCLDQFFLFRWESNPITAYFNGWIDAGWISWNREQRHWSVHTFH